MIKLDLVGTLQTYALKVSSCNNKEKIIKVIKELKEELNIKYLRKELENESIIVLHKR